MQEDTITIMHMLSLMYSVKWRYFHVMFYQVCYLKLSFLLCRNKFELSLFIKQNVFSMWLKNSFRFGSEIDFKNQEGIKVANQILKKKLLLSVLIQVRFFHYVVLSCLLLHFQEEAEVAIKGVL